MKGRPRGRDARYQGGGEMLEDLRNYRSFGGTGNTEKPMVFGGGGMPAAPDATVAVNAGGGRGARGEDPQTAAAARSLAARASSPGQTPAIRRTGSVASYQEPKKKNVAGTNFVALFLLGVICYGGYNLRPQYEYARKLREAQKTGASESVAPASGAAESSATTNAPAEPTGDEPAPQPKETAPAAGPATKAKLPEVTPEKPAPKRIEPAVTAAAAEDKGRIEKAAAENGLNGRGKIGRGSGRERG